MAQDDFMAFDDAPEAGASIKKEKGPRENTTVFVSSLPYTATTTDLITHFSFLGPVRHGFIATDRESGKSKGVGYVTYSLREDAEKAIEELDGGEFGGKGRKIKVIWADHKPTMKERGTADREPKKVKKEPVAETVKDPNAIRTLVLSGLPKDITKNVLWKRVRKVHDGVDLRYPVEGEADTAHIIFPSHNEALQSLGKLHGHTYKGLVMSCVLKKRLEKLTAGGEGKSPSHAGRLIIRNLSWDTTEQDLRSAFLPYGPIHSIDLPKAPSKLPSTGSKPAPPRARGFAFVWFLTRKDAEAAMEAMNGKVIPKAGAVKGKGKEREGEGRPIAVDWALSKDQWEKAQQDGQEVKKEDDAESSSSGSSSSSSSGDSDSDSEEDSEDSSDEGADEDAEMDDEEEEEEEPTKPKLPTVDVGSTLFVRNLSFDATEQELMTLFRTFGPLRYARITIDKSTGRSRGSGFVCFWNTEHADAAIAEAEKVAQETGANAMPLGGKNPFALPTVLTADPSSSLTSKLVLHGRTLEVSRAVTREEAGRMKEDGERARTAGDKRNTYLMREGVIFPNSPAAAALPEAEVEKRQSSFNARKTLLRSNPSLYISKTRLSIRQIPLFATDRTLKRLAIHAVRDFDKEVREETREPLSRIEEADDTLSPALAAKTSKKKGRGERETPVIQSKVVRQTEKLDPLTGQGRSKGYGFLEMRSHKDALKVLRWANNNADVGKLLAEWHAEELKELFERTKKDLEAARKENKEKEVEDLEMRVRRIEVRLGEKEAGGMRGGKTLLIEFSIENVQVVKRRVEKITAAREDAVDGKPVDRKRKAAEDSDDEPDVQDGGKGAKGRDGSKKPRRDQKRDGKPSRGGKDGKDGQDRRDGNGGRGRDGKAPAGGDNKAESKVPEKKGLEKMGAQLGSMIGRKRKSRKGGK